MEITKKREWIKCSTVAIGFYLIVYILMAHFFFGYFNPWLIGIILLLAGGDIWGLHWWIQRYGEQEDDDYP